MSDNEPKEILVECPKCGSVDFCIVQIFRFKMIKCRQCDELFGIAKPQRKKGER